jgi:hypothetical protein
MNRWILACLFSLLPATAFAAAGSWEFIGTIDGVKTWRKEVPGSDVLAFRGEYVANVHMGKLLDVFIDKTQRKHWVDRYDEHRTFENPNKMLEKYWIHFHLPFPVSDRDYVLQADGIADPNTRVFTCKIKSITDNRAPENGCCVRATAHGTYYRFEAVKGKEQVKMEVEVHTDPKGLLPNWLINLLQKSWPSKTLSRLAARAVAAGKMDADFANWHAPDAPATP